jgi:3-oxoacyl-[acyl-carrier protein] reductase
MDSQLTGRVILITGAAGGIGRALARKFAAERARLVLHYRRSRREARALQRELVGVDSIVVGADLTKESEARRLFRDAAKHFGRVDTLIANAGSWETRDVSLHEMSLRQWEGTLANVLTSTFLALREFLRLVAKQKRGNAVLISSTAGIFGEAGHADYASAKSAMAFGLTRSLKNELTRLAPHTQNYCGGRINCICPGWTVVPRTAPKLRNVAVVRKVIATMALPQLARPDDIANSAVFLASDALARHITGQLLVVAGGMEGRWLWQPGEIDPSLA